jgi:hypothetical protein
VEHLLTCRTIQNRSISLIDAPAKRNELFLDQLLEILHQTCVEFASEASLKSAEISRETTVGSTDVSSLSRLFLSIHCSQERVQMIHSLLQQRQQMEKLQDEKKKVIALKRHVHTKQRFTFRS